MIRAWRLARRVHSEPPRREAFNGRGSEINGSRWSSIGLRASFASSTRSLCVLEYLVHVDPDLLPDDLVFSQISFSDSHLEVITTLPKGWDLVGSTSAQEFGDAWLREQRSAVLQIPSVIVRDEMNYTINPEHPDFSSLAISAYLEPFTFDDRLLKLATLKT